MKTDRNSLYWYRYQSTIYFLIRKHNFPFELCYKIVNESHPLPKRLCNITQD
ncbi:hypothetical protein MtrunA17_Chr8g0351431 [Medicago truncatula]|uniref:Uncharacterized protein n=1 Tax=Medicago truncatula TaxID=3880 RepID=A0A396GFU6_MEDTR|nr:hypothetical protein MtrunA17_Chr8g0351431 [Medicago truncatula]